PVARFDGRRARLLQGRWLRYVRRHGVEGTPGRIRGDADESEDSPDDHHERRRRRDPRWCDRRGNAHAPHGRVDEGDQGDYDDGADDTRDDRLTKWRDASGECRQGLSSTLAARHLPLATDQ